MRKVVDLNGLWHFLPELEPQYHESPIYADPRWDRRNWQVVRVPGCWNLYGPQYALYEGVAWYARTFSLEGWGEGNVGVLRFGGVNYEAHVFVNGSEVGEHCGGYSEFTVDVSSALRPGENVVAVRVDNRRHRILLPACLGWYNYGGIQRSVQLELSKGARIDWAGIAAAPEGAGAALNLRVEYRPSPVEPARLRLQIQDPGGEEALRDEFEVGPGSAQTSAELRLARAVRWSPAQPALYRASLRLLDQAGEELDSLELEFGVRAVAARGGELTLNGEPIFLKGICYLPDHPLVGFSYDPLVAARDLDHLQELGVNALRSHVPLHPQFLSQCDRRGLLVIGEPPIYCLSPRENEGSAFSDGRYIALARQMVCEMIRAGYNHPSIIIWSLGNECAASHPEALGFFRQLAAAARSLDSSRPLTYASLYGEIGELAQLVDVIGINEYWGWYDRISPLGDKDEQLPRAVTAGANGSRHISVEPLSLERLREELAAKSKSYGKPLLLTEFGADAVPGYRSLDLALWSEDYQAVLIEKTIELAARSEGVCGTFPFCYQDYPDPSKHVNARWAGLNLKGIVTYSRTPKLAAAALQRCYRKLAAQ